MNPKRFKCSYCSRKYVHLGDWAFKHLEKHHADKKPRMRSISNFGWGN